MHEQIDVEPDLETKSSSITTRVWNLDRRVNVPPPPQFASPELCLVEFADRTRTWKLTQLAARERTVDLNIISLYPVSVVAEFYDADGADLPPTQDEELLVSKIERAVQEIVRRYGAYGALL